MQMTKIAVIDDEERILNLVRAYIEVGIEKPDEVEVEVFLFPQEFVEKVESGTQYDIVFSDIELGEINGIQIGRAIYEKFPDVYLVFITSHPEYAVESYMIEAYQYIMKQDIERRLPVITRRLLERIKKERMQYRVLISGIEKKKIFYKDILYIRKIKASKYVEYVTKNGNYRERIPIEQLIKQLDNDEFMMIERSYIVNIVSISEISGNTITLGEEEKLYVSRSRLPEVREQISAYWRKNGL